MCVQSIAVLSHSTSSSPDPHIVWRISVKLSDNQEYFVSKRYNDFVALNQELAKIEAPPVPLPPRSPLKLQIRRFGFLDDQFLKHRRIALNGYLKAIAHADEARNLRASRAWQEFVKVPEVRAEANASPYKALNSYYLHTFYDTERGQVLDAAVSGGFSYIRIFISRVSANNKGSNSQAVNDLEPKTLGSYDDTVLSLIDQLMVDCHSRGLKLIIAFHDRYSLGFWDTDVYATTFGIAPSGSSGAQGIVDASAFYDNNSAMEYFDKRIDHILQHKNSLMNNTSWSSLSSVIYAFEPENEACGHMSRIPYTGWMNDRAGRIKQSLGSNSGILVANGGGIDLSSSLAEWLFCASNVDIVCIHDYSTNPWSLVPEISEANGRASANGKSLLFEEWGMQGSSKASAINNMVAACNAYNIAWAYWEVTKPGQGTSGYEVWTDEESWNQLTS